MISDGSKGLRLLSSHLASSQILAEYLPLELFASGGFVAVT
jgi:hypothetical protein